MSKTNHNNFRFILSLVRIKDYTADLVRKYKKRVLVFLIFIILSTFFWFYRALDEPYITDIKFPVKFVNLPSNKILTSQPQDKIMLLVRGEGYSILSKKLQIKKPYLSFDVNDFSLHNQSIDSLRVFLLTRNVLESLSHQLISENDQLEILGVLPDTIFLSFSKMKHKKVPVKPDFLNNDNLFAQQHTMNGNITLNPDSVVVMGPSSLVDTIHHIRTVPIDFIDLKDSVDVRIHLQKVEEIKLSSEKTQMIIPVDRFTEANFSLPIQVRNTPDSLILKVFPQSAKISYHVTLSHYKEISQHDFVPFVDYKEIGSEEAGMNPKLKVYLDAKPNNAFNTSVYPTDVEFLIETNNAEDRDYGRNR